MSMNYPQIDTAIKDETQVSLDQAIAATRSLSTLVLLLERAQRMYLTEVQKDKDALSTAYAEIVAARKLVLAARDRISRVHYDTVHEAD